MTESTAEVRAQRLAAEHYNNRDLDPLHGDVDLRSDVQPLPRSAAVIEAAAAAMRGDERGLDVQTAAAELYGRGFYVPVTKGRSAELALAACYSNTLSVVVSPGLFPTTARVASSYGSLESAPTSDDQSCDIDLEWLSARLGREPHVGAVWVEAANNAVFGRPLRLANLEATAALCRRHSARLFLDGTRLMTNCSHTGDGLSSVRALTEQVDAFTVSCAKEALVPDGALACVRDEALYRRVTAYATQAGTILNTADSRARLAAALAEVPRAMDRFQRRTSQVEVLAAALAARGIACVEPACGHAVWVPVTSLVVGGDPSSTRDLEAQLYIASGVLAWVWKTRAGDAIRLAVPIDRYDDAALNIVVDAIHALFERCSERPPLEMLPGENRGDVRARFRRRTP